MMDFLTYTFPYEEKEFDKNTSLDTVLASLDFVANWCKMEVNLICAVEKTNNLPLCPDS